MNEDGRVVRGFIAERLLKHKKADGVIRQQTRKCEIRYPTEEGQYYFFFTAPLSTNPSITPLEICQRYKLATGA